ncbi:MAG: hypothetical protein J2O47_03165 [Acidimicrobiaceae bacterium]|nr:hypothetical protein [Acidimicrobiaceae bacterium]
MTAGHVAGMREKAAGVYEITVSVPRRDPTTGKYPQISRTVRAAPRRVGQKGYPKAVEAEVAKLLGEVEGGGHRGDARR